MVTIENIRTGSFMKKRFIKHTLTRFDELQYLQTRDEITRRTVVIQITRMCF